MNWQENFLSFVNVYFSQLFSGGPKKQRNILVPFYVAMVVEGGGGPHSYILSLQRTQISFI